MIDQATADWYLQIAKKRTSNEVHNLAVIKKLSIALQAPDVPSEEFLLDIHKNTIRLSKFTFHGRVRRAIGLIRVDFDPRGSHKNPDGIIIKGSHIHIYKEGFDLKWAYPIPHLNSGRTFVDLGNFSNNLDQFFSYCNIVEPPLLQMGLL